MTAALSGDRDGVTQSGIGKGRAMNETPRRSVAPHLALGTLVRCEHEPEWGVGQVQSIINDRVTVTFAEAGKKVFIGEEAADTLEPCDV